MTGRPMERKLTAILSADVEGYSRLMGDDEAATVRTITAYREVIAAVVAGHAGRVVDSPGDNVLAEFASVVDAVEAALEIQRTLAARNEELPPSRRMRFRIGINLGDVIVEGDRIYGDGVNIAARVQSLADGGGLSLSGTAYDQIAGKLSIACEAMGEHAVKNIARPVRVYRVRFEADGGPHRRATSRRPRAITVTVASVALALLLAAGSWAAWRYLGWHDAHRLPLPDKPSVAVLPFSNLSHDPAQDYFSDGVTEDLITDLSKVSGLFVIARNSVFTYKGKPVKVRDVGRDLGVRYVLEGSIQRSADRVRITAQLVDATTGFHVWAERYDREVRDLFAVQDEVTQKIVAALAVKLTADERQRIVRQGTGVMEAYDLVLRGHEARVRTTREGNEQARQYFLKAIELDPRYAAAYAGLSWTYLQSFQFLWSADRDTLARARELAERAIALNNSLVDCYHLLAQVSLWQKDWDPAIAHAERAVSLAPNDADGYETLAEVLAWSGRADESVRLIRQAMRLNPHYPFYYVWTLGHAYYLTQQRQEALDAFARLLELNPNFTPAYAYRALVLSEMGRFRESQEAWTRSGMGHVASMQSLRDRLPYRRPQDLDRLLTAAQRAGVR